MVLVLAQLFGYSHLLSTKPNIAVESCSKEPIESLFSVFLSKYLGMELPSRVVLSTSYLFSFNNILILWEFHSIYCSYSQTQLLPDASPSLHSPSFFFLSICFPVDVAQIVLNVRSAVECGPPTRGHAIKENWWHSPSPRATECQCPIN